MGIETRFNEFAGKWETIGCGFRKYYDTKEDAIADTDNCWQLHQKNLQVRSIVSNMLLSYR